MEYTYLSYNIHEKSLVYKGLKEPQITHQSKISSDGYNTYIICLENHSGTHIDAPRHFLADGKAISEYAPGDFIFDNVVILKTPQNPKGIINIDVLNGLNLSGVDCLLIFTGFGKYREIDPEKYLTESPGISPDFIHHIRKHFPSIKILGIDCVSISSYGDEEMAINAHKTAFVEKEYYGEPLRLIEDMKLQDISIKNTIEKLIVLPWQIKGVDSTPCTVVAQLQ